MADEQSNSGSVWMSILKALGGAVITVLTAVLIYKFTQPKPQQTPPVIVTAPSPIEVDGFVDAAATHQLLRNASITVTLGESSVQQLTDPSGRYAVVFSEPSAPAAMGKVTTQADGFKPYTNSIALHTGDNFAEIELDSLAPPMPTLAQSAPSPAPVQAMILRKPPANYIKLPTAAFAFKSKP